MMEFSFKYEISLKFVPRSPTDNTPALVQVMAWGQAGNQPLPEPMMKQIGSTRETRVNLTKI